MYTMKEMSDEQELAFFKSEAFREGFRKQVEKDTWERGLPKIYMDDEGWLVEHWKDGRIIRKQKLK